MLSPHLGKEKCMKAGLATNTQHVIYASTTLPLTLNDTDLGVWCVYVCVCARVRLHALPPHLSIWIFVLLFCHQKETDSSSGNATVMECWWNDLAIINSYCYSRVWRR